MVHAQIKLKEWHWRPEDGTQNFGDEIGLLILQRLGYDVEYTDKPEEADIFTTGSIVSYINTHAKDGAIVWGSGALEDDITEDFRQRFDVAAVRGHLTGRRIDSINGLMSAAKGDPALLAPLFWRADRAVTYSLGVIRHHLDRNEYPMADIIIDATEPVEEVIRKLNMCVTVASSSLHGLILAHAYGIPAMRIPRDDIIGGDWKFMDFLTTQQMRLDLVQQDLLVTLRSAIEKRGEKK